jgi:DNA-binding SARP family transcriptional activator
MSNRSLEIPRLDERVDELSAVLDHAGIDRGYVMGTSEGGPMALMFAATYPDRVLGVILDSSSAWLVPDEAERQHRTLWERFRTTWGTSESVTVELFAPSLAGDVDFQRWHQRYERNSASRDAIGVLLELGLEMDARDVLHRLECPVLMLHRVGDRVVPVQRARQTRDVLRSHGVEVELVEQPGEDHFLYAADLPAALGVIERFTTGIVRDRPAAWRTARSEIITLGRFDVVVGGVPVPPSVWGSRQARTLLMRLVVARGWPVTRDELIDVLWPDSSQIDRLGPRLSVQLATVRRVLGGGIVADRSSIRLDLTHVDVDIERWFTRTDDPAIVAEYNGEFLPDARYEDWSAALRQEIRGRFVAAACRLAETSPTDSAIALWRRVLADDPYDEGAHRSLIATLRSEGRWGEARAAYHAYVPAMDELGITATPWEEITR